MRVRFALFFILLLFFIPIKQVFAITDPTSVQNNKFGIHILSGTEDEAQAAADLVNSSGGDWGYVTVIIRWNDRSVSKWQEFFNILRRKHLIPIVRLATQPQGGSWEHPDANAAQGWADFLNQLYWPVQNRYVIVYNEPNHATEWGNSVNAADYARVLDQTITALKSKSQDFFVLNAGLDASAPEKMPAYEDEVQFLTDMNTTVPGIFNKIDGWDSHSYPNPGFAGLPSDSGRGTIKTYQWEEGILTKLGASKKLPVFITETGWQHDEGLSNDPALPTVNSVADYYKQAFQQVWNDPNIVAVTPFLLDYQQPPFDHFSFQRVTGKQDSNEQTDILGAKFPNFYPQYDSIVQIPKVSGDPIQTDSALLEAGEFYPSIAYGQNYKIPIKVKNVGNKIWDSSVSLNIKNPLDGLSIIAASIPKGTYIDPGQDYTFTVNLKANKLGNYSVILNLYDGIREFSSPPFLFTTDVKSPVHLVIDTHLLWKKIYAGNYTLTVSGPSTFEQRQISINKIGQSPLVDIPTLLPDTKYTFSLQRPYYDQKSVERIVEPGTNLIFFGNLDPNLTAALLNPVKLWQLLPLSN